MQITTNPIVKETIFEETLDNGLKIHLLTKPGFAKKEVSLTIGFGGIDRTVVSVTDSTDQKKFPEGTAHFLEHMLFESENDNISNRFTATGASVNAYTSSNKTTYFFSTTNGVKEPLLLLLDLVFSPHFTEELVNKERKIIAKEIQMYEDDMDQMIYQDTLSALFREHPIRTDIAGSESSIASIDKHTLDLAYETFYQPANIHLIIVGDIDAEAMINVIKSYSFRQKTKSLAAYKRLPAGEEPRVHRSLVSKKKDVKTDLLMLGIKLDKTKTLTPMENDIEEVKWAFLFDNVFGKTSKVYRDLMDRKLINDTFEFSVTLEDDYGYILLFTETKKPARTKKALMEVLLRLPEYFSDEERFAISKKKMFGNFIQSFDHISAISSILTEYLVSGVDIFRLHESIARLSFQSLKEEYPVFSDQSVAVVHYHS